jgi:CheY-like chemotaxis protein
VKKPRGLKGKVNFLWGQSWLIINQEYPNSILVIEDDAAQHSLLLESLTKKIPYLKVDFAADGRKGWDMASNHSYDFIILDWKLSSDLHGVGLLNRFRQSKEYQSTPILVISGYLKKEDFALMEEFPFTGHVEKPYRSIFIVKRIKDLYDEAFWFREKNISLVSASKRLSDKPDRFLEVVLAACKDSPRPQIIAMAGAKILRERGHLDEALLLIKTYQAKHIDSVMLLGEMGEIYIEMGELDKATKFLDAAVMRSPQNLDRLCDLGGIHLQELDPGDARSNSGLHLAENVNDFFQVTNPTSIPSSFAGLLNVVGITLVRRGEIDQGLKHYVSALSYVQSNMDRAKLAFNLALGYLRDVNPEEAKVWFEKSLNLEPEYEKARKYLSKLAVSTSSDRGEGEYITKDSALYADEESASYVDDSSIDDDSDDVDFDDGLNVDSVLYDDGA